MSLGGIRDPLDPDRRHVLAARGGRGRVRRLERRRRRRCRRELGPGADEPVEVRELSGGAAARARRQRDDRHGRDPDVLEPRPDLQRHRGAGPADPLDPSPAADRALPGVHGAGLLELRARGVSRGAGDVVRRAAGERGGRGAPEPASHAAAGAGHARSCESTAVDLDAATGCSACADGPRRATRAGAGSTSRRRSRALGEARSRRATSTRRTTTLGPRAYPALGLEPPDPGDRRLLGRPGRRLRDPARARTSPSTSVSRAADPSVDLSLAFWLPQARSIERVADFRYRVRTSARTGLAAVPLVPPARRRARSTIQVRMSSPGATRYRLDRKGRRQTAR